jgi:hypothetical protein
VLERADPRRGCPDLTADHRVTEAQAARLLDAMRSAFDAASVPHEVIARLEPAMTNEAKDRHVLATAVAGDAQAIVTLNLKHFPSYACQLPSLPPPAVDPASCRVPHFYHAF